MSRTWVRVATSLGFALLVLGQPGVSAPAGQDEPIELRTVVGCLARDADSWTLERATEGEPTERAFTSQDEIAVSRQQALGSLTYRLLGARCRWTRRSQGPGQGTAAAQGRRVPGRPSGSDPDPHSPGSLICQL